MGIRVPPPTHPVERAEQLAKAAPLEPPKAEGTEGDVAKPRTAKANAPAGEPPAKATAPEQPPPDPDAGGSAEQASDKDAVVI